MGARGRGVTEAIPATPGWVDEALDRMFADLGPDTDDARSAFAACLAGSKIPATPSDLLGAEFERCHSALRRALLSAGLERELVAVVLSEAEALEAEVAAES